MSLHETYPLPAPEGAGAAGDDAPRSEYRAALARRLCFELAGRARLLLDLATAEEIVRALIDEQIALLRAAAPDRGGAR